MAESINENVIEAAGGIVERLTSEGPLIAVICRERYGEEWALPKGKRKPGETWQQTALREVEEEIGVRAVIVGLAGATTYLAQGVPKLVLYWHMRAENEAAFTPNEEVTKVAWLKRTDAMHRLTHQEERELLR
jgi:ADP-ribose pyrophosphatase YjhB (NUDIX family)